MIIEAVAAVVVVAFIGVVCRSLCLFSHGQCITTRVDGVLSYQCERCHQSLGPVLQAEMLKDGPAHSPAKVHGQPKETAQLETPRRTNVAPWKVGVNR